MRRRARISVDSKDNEELQFIYDKIKGDLYEGNIYNGYFTVKIYEDTEGYKLLVDEIQKRSLKYSFAEAREYTKQEIKNAEFFLARFIYPWEHNPDNNAETYGTKYIGESGCTGCGRGKKQISELIVDMKKVIKYKISTIIPEIMVSPDVMAIIEESRLTGVSFGSVRDYKNREMPSYYQMFIQNVLQKMSDEIRVEIQDITTCKVCGTGGLFLRSEAIYETEKLTNALDFNLTSEYFWSANYCRREPIVSAKVRDVFNKYKIKFGSEPVSIRKDE